MNNPATLGNQKEDLPVNRTLSTWVATFALAACLSTAAPAQTVRYDWTTTPVYRTTVDPFQLTPAQRTNLETVIRSQSTEVEPIFIRERSGLMPILTPQQLIIYDQMVAPRYYYTYSVLRPEDWVAYRQNVVTRLNLTPDQQTRYLQVVNVSDGALTPIVTRYETRYSSVLTPEQWVSYRTGARTWVSSTEQSGSSSSSSSEEYRRVYKETTVQTSVDKPMTATPMAAPQKTTRALNWRNQDLK